LPLEKRSEFIKALEDISLSEFYSDEYWEKSEEFTNQFDEYRLEFSPMSYSFENYRRSKMIKRYLKITRSDCQGSYVEEDFNIMNALSAELDGMAEYANVGDSVTVTVVEMDEEEFKDLEEFTGW
jgi:hypothetical protein